MQGAEVKRKISMRLPPGGYQLTISGASYQATNLKAIVLKGEEGVLSLQSTLEDCDSLSPLSHQTQDTRAFTLFESENMISYETNTPEVTQDHKSNTSHSTHDEVMTLEAQYTHILRAQKHAEELLISWVSESIRQPQLDLAEWREGLEVLEVMLSEQARELKRLKAEINQQGGQPQDQYHNFINHSGESSPIEGLTDTSDSTPSKHVHHDTRENSAHELYVNT